MSNVSFRRVQRFLPALATPPSPLRYRELRPALTLHVVRARVTLFMFSNVVTTLPPMPLATDPSRNTKRNGFTTPHSLHPTKVGGRGTRPPRCQMDDHNSKDRRSYSRYSSPCSVPDPFPSPTASITPFSSDDDGQQVNTGVGPERTPTTEGLWECRRSSRSPPRDIPSPSIVTSIDRRFHFIHLK